MILTNSSVSMFSGASLLPAFFLFAKWGEEWNDVNKCTWSHATSFVIRLVHSVPDLQIHRVYELKVDTTEHDKDKDDK